MALEGAKPILLYRWDSTNKEWIKWDGVLSAGDIEIGAVEIKNSIDDTRATVSSKGLHVFDTVANSLIPSSYDYISLSYTGSDLTGVVFKTGGAGSTVSTLTLAYTDGNLVSVTKT